MPSERAIVETLNRKQLLDLVTHFDLQVTDRRVRDNLVDAIASSRRTRIDAILQQLPLAGLKEVCRKHGIDDSGRKAQLIDRILAQKPAAKSKAAKPAATKKAAAKPKAPAKKAVAAKAPLKAKATTKKVVAKSKAAAAKATPAKKAPAAKAPAVKPKAKPKPKAVKAAAVAKPAKRAASSVKAAAKPKAAAAAKAVAPKAAKPAKPAPKEKSVSAKAKAVVDKVSAATKAAASKAAAAVSNVIELPRGGKLPAPAKNGAGHPSPEPAKTVKATPPRVVPNPAKQAAAVAAATSTPPVAQPISPDEKPRPFGVQMTAQAVREALANAPQPLPLLPEVGNYVPTSGTQACFSCGTKLELRKCGVQRCTNMLVANPTRKICAECLFERNTLSMDDFNARLEEEARCPHCNDNWQDS